MGSFTVEFTAHHRDESGRFVSRVHDGAVAAARQGGEVLQKMVMSAIIADGLVRTGSLLASVQVDGGGTQVRVHSGNDHAMPLETGARPHRIPNAFGWGITVWHPGNRPYRFFKTASDAFKGIFPGIVREHMP